MTTYRGITYLVASNPRMRFPLAYIRIPDNHKWMEIEDYDDIPLEVHGGVTFMEVITKKNQLDFWQGFSEGKWIGWDYGHAGDFVDYGFKLRYSYPEKVWTSSEVIEEIKNAIRQLLKAK